MMTTGFKTQQEQLYDVKKENKKKRRRRWVLGLLIGGTLATSTFAGASYYFNLLAPTTKSTVNIQPLTDALANALARITTLNGQIETANSQHNTEMDKMQKSLGQANETIASLDTELKKANDTANLSSQKDNIDSANNSSNDESAKITAADGMTTYVIYYDAEGYYYLNDTTKVRLTLEDGVFYKTADHTKL